MKFLPIFVLLLGIVSNKFISANTDIYYSIQDDLRDLNATCPDKSTCAKPRFTDTWDFYSCHCSEICTRLNTCCADSMHTYAKPPKVVQRCRQVDGSKSYFMVDRCPESSVWESLCHEEWNGDDDIMKLVPVTSLFTHITYKNYFCFRCHESGDDFLYWNVKLESFDDEFDETIDKNKISVSYDQSYRTWMAPLGTDGTWIPVNMTINVPSEIWRLPISCIMNIISNCSDKWTDKNVSDKCDAYMGMVYITKDSGTLMYRNTHCALCNFEDLVNMRCTLGYGGGWGSVPFSFALLLDVNRSDGDEVGKVRKCENNFLWDPYAKKCREVACALPGYVVKDGKCTPP